MNVNTPDNDPRQSPASHADARPADNPYYNAQAHAATAGPAPGQPDLDANAPVLRTTDSQRLNRKALAFLAGILGLIAVMAFLVVKGAGNAEDKTRKTREEAVVVPELQAPAPLPPMPAPAEPVQPIALAQEPVMPPPLPADPAMPPASETPTAPPPPSLLDRRISAINDEAGAVGSSQQNTMNDLYAQAVMASLKTAQGAAGQAPQEPAEPATVAQMLQNPDALLARGTYIRCILETRIVTDVPGYTSCVVTEPVYSINGRRLLLPKGSKVLGKYRGEPTGPRVAVIWDRVLTPNGLDVTMASPGIDNLGGAGHPGDYSAHWGSRMGAALLISLISDAFKYAAAEEGPRTATVGAGGVVVDAPFESNTARTMERLAHQALAKAANRPATVTINQGTMVSVYVARDVDFSQVLAN